MVAILIATGQNPAFHGLDEHLPIPLLPLADRPFLQHVVEYLVHQGIRRFEFVLSHLPEKIEAALGDGARWGCSFRYQLAPSQDDALRLARGIAGDGPVLLGSGTCLPEFALSALEPDTLIRYAGAWTGWGLFAAAASISETLGRSIEASAILSIESPEQFLASQRVALDGTFAGLLISGRDSEPGVRISRNVAIHPSARITAPVYIGENCRIAAGASIGPSAVIGANGIVDEHSIVVNALVAPGSYVGEALELDTVIVDRNRILNVRLGASFLVSETFLLGSLTERSKGRGLVRARDRLIALLLLLFMWPVLLVTYVVLSLSRRGKLSLRQAVDLPAETDPASWRQINIWSFATDFRSGGGTELFCRMLPGLVSVLSGDLSLVGVQPRSPASIQSLPDDWRSMYLKSKAGLITEADVMFGPGASEDEVYTSEVFYSATESSWHDLKLALLWLRNLFARRPEITPDLADEAGNS